MIHIELRSVISGQLEPKNQLWLIKDQHHYSETFALLGP